MTADQVEALIADAPAADPCAFVPTDAAGVDWVLKKISAARAEAALIRANGEAMAREAERRAEHLEWKFGPALQAYARQELEGGKKKSIRLFHGVIGFRTKSSSVEIINTGLAIEWAREFLPIAVMTKLDTTDAKRALTEMLAETGELPPFARPTPSEEVFYIK